MPDGRLDRDVAIKVLPDRLADTAEALARFQREAKMLAAVSHPNLITIFDVGMEHGIGFAVMEFLAGETLRDSLLGHASVDPRSGNWDCDCRGAGRGPRTRRHSP